MIALTLVLIAPALIAPLAAPTGTTRPNVVLVLVDDAAMTDFGAYGGEARTPNIDALAAARRALHELPHVAALLALARDAADGHRQPSHRRRHHRGGAAAGACAARPATACTSSPACMTVATRLKRAGYRTYMTGKWHLGHGAGDLPDAHGFDRSFALDASGADNWEQKPLHAVLPDGAVVRGR